eukprot:jgi/Hompol1/4949/HPOL_004049-RA
MAAAQSILDNLLRLRELVATTHLDIIPSPSSDPISSHPPPPATLEELESMAPDTAKRFDLQEAAIKAAAQVAAHSKPHIVVDNKFVSRVSDVAVVAVVAVVVE